MEVIMRLIWPLVSRFFRSPCRRVSFPAGILGNPDVHWVIYDANGICREGTGSFLEAFRKRENMYIQYIKGDFWHEH